MKDMGKGAVKVTEFPAMLCTSKKITSFNW